MAGGSTFSDALDGALGDVIDNLGEHLPAEVLAKIDIGDNKEKWVAKLREQLGGSDIGDALSKVMNDIPDIDGIKGEILGNVQEELPSEITSLIGDQFDEVDDLVEEGLEFIENEVAGDVADLLGDGTVGDSAMDALPEDMDFGDIGDAFDFSGDAGAVAEAATSGKFAKATFMALDGPLADVSFEVQYNPKDFKYDKAVSWTHVGAGADGSKSDNELPQYSHNKPATMSCELLFDTTRDASDVRTSWVNKLLEFTNPDAEPTTGEPALNGGARPPQVQFTWGTFSMTGVIDSLSTTYTMFGADGTPLRAKVALKMTEWKAEAYSASGTQVEAYGSDPVEMVTLQAGQTLTSVAIDNGMTTSELAAFNGIDDPFALDAGASILLPG